MLSIYQLKKIKTMKKIFSALCAITLIAFLSFLNACNKKANLNNTPTSSVSKEDPIQRVKDFYSQLKGKKTRSSIQISDDSLVYMIEAQANYTLADFSYNSYIYTRYETEIEIPYTGEGYASNDIDGATEELINDINDDFQHVNTNNDLSILYIDLEILEKTTSFLKVKGIGVYGYPGYSFPPGYDTSYRRVFNYNSPQCPWNMKGFCWDETSGKRLVSPPGDPIDGYMCVMGRQKTLDYIYPSGIPVNYGWYMIDINSQYFEPQTIASNPYRPSCTYNQWQGYSEDVCFSKPEMNFYLDLASPRIKTFLDNNSRNFIDCFWNISVPFDGFNYYYYNWHKDILLLKYGKLMIH